MHTVILDREILIFGIAKERCKTKIERFYHAPGKTNYDPDCLMNIIQVQRKIGCSQHLDRKIGATSKLSNLYWFRHPLLT